MGSDILILIVTMAFTFGGVSAQIHSLSRRVARLEDRLDRCLNGMVTNPHPGGDG